MRARLFLLGLVLVTVVARADSPRVAVAGAPPFVQPGAAADAPGGFAVELWQSVADASGWTCSYLAYPSTDEALAALERGDCDVVVGNTSITAERERRVEFSQPFYRSGLQIMVSENRRPVVRWVGRLLAPEHLSVLGVVLLGVLVATGAVAIFERRHNPDFPRTRGAGLAEAFYYVMGLVTGKSAYKGFSGVLGRLVLVGWMVASLFVVSYVTSAITSSMTAELLAGHIHGPQDLPGKMIGLVGGTQSEDYARARNLDYSPYPHLAAAVADLLAGKVQGILGDAPVLQDYDYTHPHVPVHEVGPIFQPVDYGFAVRVNSQLRKPINVALLHLRENGELDALGEKFFGASYQQTR